MRVWHQLFLLHITSYAHCHNGARRRKAKSFGGGCGYVGCVSECFGKSLDWLGFFFVPIESIFFAGWMLHVWDTYLSDLHTSFSQCLVNTITIHYAKGLRVRFHSHLATAHIHAPYWHPTAARRFDQWGVLNSFRHWCLLRSLRILCVLRMSLESECT